MECTASEGLKAMMVLCHLEPAKSKECLEENPGPNWQPMELLERRNVAMFLNFTYNPGCIVSYSLEAQYLFIIISGNPFSKEL